MKYLPGLHLILLALAMGSCSAPQTTAPEPVQTTAPARSSLGEEPVQTKVPAKPGKTRVGPPKSSLNQPPTPEALAAADYGSQPAQDYETQISTTMNELLKDPESARYRFMTPEKSWLPRYHFDQDVPGQPHQHGHVFGWIVHFGVNAKNSYGGYSGEEAYEAYFKDGTLRGILQRSEYKDIFGYTMWDLMLSK